MQEGWIIVDKGWMDVDEGWTDGWMMRINDWMNG